MEDVEARVEPKHGAVACGRDGFDKTALVLRVRGAEHQKRAFLYPQSRKILRKALLGHDEVGVNGFRIARVQLVDAVCSLGGNESENTNKKKKVVIKERRWKQARKGPGHGWKVPFELAQDKSLDWW